MSEPEDVLIDAAEVATEAAVSVWKRHRADAEDEAVALEDVERRLALFLKATVGLDAPIVVAEPPRPAIFLVRWMRGTPDFLVRRHPVPSTDGARIRLPRELPLDGEATGREFARYRLYAVEQALRIRRGTARHAPDPEEEPLRRTLYQVAEAAAVDLEVSRSFPGLVDDLRIERRRALEQRPPDDELEGAETAVESLVRDLLEGAPDAPPSTFGDQESPVPPRPAASLEWAESRGRQLGGEEAVYRGLPPAEVWGIVDREASAPDSTRAGGGAGGGQDEKRSRKVDRRPRAREADEPEDDNRDGWFIPQDDLHETAQDPMGLQRPVDRDDEVDPEELAESLSEMQQGKLVRTDDAAREVLVSEDPPPRAAADIDAPEIEGVRYPEWDYRSAAYVAERATVRVATVEPGSGRWAREAKRRRSRLIHEVRRCFEQLRPRRKRLRRQPDGPEIDVGAYVEAYGDRMAGAAPEDRLYRTIRPGRREIAIELLVDVSASTDSWIRDDKRVIDVEKEALLVVCEALDALGDRYAVSTFSGRGPEAVRLRTVKDFDEEYGREIRRRIGTLAPDRYTRCGAAIRHATARVRAQEVRHPVVLMLSDGKPNDADIYERQYGVEDTAQAVHEAHMQGVEVFCLTVDREAPTYMDRIFGPGAYAVLHEPALLPKVLVRLVRRLLDR